MFTNNRAPRNSSGRALTFYLVGSSAVMLGSTTCALPHTEAAPNTARVDAVHLSIATNKEEYTAGEAIDITLTVTNGTDQAVTLEFMSGQRFDLIIHTAANREVWRWGLTRGFIQMLGSEQLAPGAQKVYNHEFTGDLRPGAYTIVGVLASRNYPLEARSRFTVR